MDKFNIGDIVTIHSYNLKSKTKIKYKNEEFIQAKVVDKYLSEDLSNHGSPDYREIYVVEIPEGYREELTVGVDIFSSCRGNDQRRCIITSEEEKHRKEKHKEKKQMKKDIKTLIGYWFSALEDEGAEPWTMPECIVWAAKYGYTKADYQKYLNTIC